MHESLSKIKEPRRHRTKDRFTGTQNLNTGGWGPISTGDFPNRLRWGQ
jgi:hypothetical protein